MSVDVFVEHLQQLLFFFDHLQQRLQRRQRQAARHRRADDGALDVNRSPVRASRRTWSSRAASPARAARRTADRSSLMRSKTASRARCSGSPENFAVEIVRGLAQVVGLEPLADVDDLLNHVSAAGDDDAPRTRVSLSGTNSTRSKTATACADRLAKPDRARGLRQHRARRAAATGIEQAVRAVAPQSRFDRGRGIPSAAWFRAARST